MRPSPSDLRTLIYKSIERNRTSIERNRISIERNRISIERNRILPRISDSIDIRLRSAIESQSVDCVRLHSIDSIGIFVRFRSIDIVR